MNNLVGNVSIIINLFNNYDGDVMMEFCVICKKNIYLLIMMEFSGKRKDKYIF